VYPLPPKTATFKPTPRITPPFGYLFKFLNKTVDPFARACDNKLRR
jgi:hypothetical protein